jgi:hypothetical protein
MTACGLPHSEISGSSLVSSSPKLIAACYVLHRLWCQGIHLCALVFFLKTLRSGSAPEPKSKLHPSITELWRDRLHVWHMKIHLYAVFKDRE